MADKIKNDRTMNNDDIAFFIWHKAMVEMKINDPTFPRHSYDNGWESMD